MVKLSGIAKRTADTHLQASTHTPKTHEGAKLKEVMVFRVCVHVTAHLSRFAA